MPGATTSRAIFLGLPLLSGTSTGVYVGVCASDFGDLLARQPLDRIDAYHASGVAHSMVSGRLSYVLGLQGPSISVDTACSSSLVAIHLACQGLRAGDCRMAVTGDTTQIDLPRGVTSGLVEAERILRGVPGIGFTHFTAEDVVRHPLVARIIRAYDSTGRAADD